jgi:hypothetical protein
MTRPTNLSGGRRKGGTQFPQIALKKAVEYAKKLVSKTHTEAQPAAIILKGVFDSASSLGQVRASALKQYKLMSGPASAYEATDLAKRINSAPPNELQPLLREACLSPQLFKNLYATFQNDTVSRAKIKQQALQLKVHPDSGDKATGMFVESLVYAQMATEDGEGNVKIAQSTSGAEILPSSTGEDVGAPSEEADDDTKDDHITNKEDQSTDIKEPPPSGDHLPPTPIRSQMNVNLSLDSTMDPDKLEKSLTLLRRYGVI